MMMKIGRNKSIAFVSFTIACFVISLILICGCSSSSDENIENQIIEYDAVAEIDEAGVAKSVSSLARKHQSDD